MYWYGGFSNCQKDILNPYLYYALNNESHMAKFQAIICHRSFVDYSWKESEKENHGKWRQVGENEEVRGK